MSVEVVNPFDSYRADSGVPLDAGKLYVGVANLDPQTNPIEVFYDPDLTIAAPQPLATSGGYVWRSGAPARIYVAERQFSMRLLTQNDQQVFYAASYSVQGEILDTVDALNTDLTARFETADDAIIATADLDRANRIAADNAIIASTSAQDTVLLGLINALANGSTKAFLTYAALDAAKATLPANSFARVTNDPTPANNWLWQWNGTVLTKSDRDDLAVALAAVTVEESARVAADTLINAALANIFGSVKFNGYHDDVGNSFLFAVLDAIKRVGFGITRDLDVFFGGNRISIDQISGVRDAAGRYALAVTKTGTVYAPNLILSASTLAQIPISDPELTVSLQRFVAMQRNHIVVYGQSLSIGFLTGAPISTTQPYSNIMFSSGMLKSIGDAGYAPTGAVVPMIEVDDESPTAGVANGFVRRIVAAGGTAANYPMFGTSSGVGGKTIAELTADDLYVRLSQHVTDAKASAVAAGQSYAVSSIVWIQGESDLSNAIWTRAIDYYQRYLALMTKIRKTAITISKQAFLPTIYSYQTSAHMKYNKRYLGIAIAQWRASVERADICLATPAYRLPHAPDNLHLTNEGSWLLGEYIARAMYWTMIKGQKWRPLEPIDVAWTATHVDVKYHVPCKPIQLSTVICNAATNQGFDIWTNGSVYDSGAASNDDTLISDAISSVTVLSDDTIRITFNPAVTIPADAVLSYGRGRLGDPQAAGPVTGARGNVVDSHGLYDVVTSPLANNFALYNVSVYFEHGRKDSFFQ